MTALALPTSPQTRESLQISAMNARVMLAGMPKSGKSTLAASWAPESTLIIDTQKGTTLLPGEHYVQHVSTWPEFEATINMLVADPGRFGTVVIDMIDDVWNFVDQHCAGRGNVLATSTDDYNRSAKNAEGTFRRTIGQLLATNLGVWFLTHTRVLQDGQATRYVPRLDGKVLTYVEGAVQFILLAETLGPRRQLHTAPTAKFQAGSRVPLPEPMEMDARKLYAAIAAGLKPTSKQEKTA
jgi:hypothetical protein